MYCYNSLSTLILSVLFCLTLSVEQCVKNSHCSCNTENNAEVSLEGIAGELGYLETDIGDKYKYRFYPCGIKENWGERCTEKDDPAFCQYINTQKTIINLGRLETMQVMSYKEYATVFNYTGGSTFGSANRSSEIALVCTPDASETVFKFIEESKLGHYKFEISSYKVCAGQVDIGCQRIDPCTCKLDDGKGLITVHGLFEKMKIDRFHFKDQETFYSLFPCSIKGNSSIYTDCNKIIGDPAACMRTPDGERFTLGLQTQMKFRVTQNEPFTTALIYNGGDTISNMQIRATLLLQCGTNSTPQVKFLGRNPWLDYNFLIVDDSLCPHW